MALFTRVRLNTWPMTKLIKVNKSEHSLSAINGASKKAINIKPELIYIYYQLGKQKWL